MKKSIVWAILCIVVASGLFACSKSSSDSTPAPATTTYGISGTVTLSGTGLQGVTVALSSTNTTTTDVNGSYSFTGLANGSYTVTPSKTGYTFSPVNKAVTISNADSTGNNFTATATPITTTTEFPIATTSVREMSVSAAFDGTNYLVGIQGYQNPNSNVTVTNSNVTAQLVSGSTGSLVGLRISSIGRTGGAPSVAFDGTNYMMVWPDDMASHGLNDDLYGQLISTTGQLVGAAFLIAPQIGYQNGGPIIFDGSNYFVVWETRSNSNSGDSADIYGQFITPSGTLLGAAIPISTASHGQRDPAVAFDGTNILVAWTDSRNQSACYTITDTQGTHTVCPESDVYGQLVAKSSASTAGSLTGGNFLINASSLPRDGNGVSVAFDGTNYFVVILEETTLPNACPASDCKWDLYGQFVTKAGVTTGSKVTISNTAPDHHFQQVVWNGTKYLATWIESFGTPTTSVKGGYFDTSGGPIGSELNLFSAGTNGVVPWYVTPIVNGTNYFMIVNKGIPGTDPFNIDVYTSADVFGALITP